MCIFVVILYHYSVLFYISPDIPFYAFMYFVFHMYSAKKHGGLVLYQLINYYYHQNAFKYAVCKMLAILFQPQNIYEMYILIDK